MREWTKMNKHCVAVALGAALVTLGLPPLVQAATPLVSGQTLNLPLTDDSDGPVLKFVVAKAVFTGSYYQAAAPVPGETRADREARGNQVVLDNPDGRDLVKFVRFAADDLRGRYTGSKTTVTVSAVFTDGLKVDQGKLMGDAFKAGLTLGIGTPATIAINFFTHMEITIGGPDGASRVLTCDAQAQGRVPRYPRANNPHGHDELERMADVARKACYAKIVAALDTPPAPTAAPPAAAAPVAPKSPNG